MKLEGHIRGFEHVFVNWPIVVTCYLFSILFNNACTFFFAFSHLRLWYKKLEKILILGNLVFSKTFSETRRHYKNNEPLFKVSINGLKNLIKHSFSIVSSATFFLKKKNCNNKKSCLINTENCLIQFPYSNISIIEKEGFELDF